MLRIEVKAGLNNQPEMVFHTGCTSRVIVYFFYLKNIIVFDELSFN